MIFLILRVLRLVGDHSPFHMVAFFPRPELGEDILGPFGDFLGEGSCENFSPS
jgi:hypothetical protein